jgi:hypothetical protein
VRTDIPLADQVVQVCHACLEAGTRFGLPPAHERPSHLVVLGVASEGRLRRALADLEARGVRYVVFWEPDDGMGYAAACTEPVGTTGRRFFRRFSLWQPGPTVERVTPTLDGPAVRGPPGVPLRTKGALGFCLTTYTPVTPTFRGVATRDASINLVHRVENYKAGLTIASILLWL